MVMQNTKLHIITFETHKWLILISVFVKKTQIPYQILDHATFKNESAKYGL